MVTSPIRKRTVVVAGHTTSVSLEDPFWHALLEIAVERRLSLTALISAIASKREQSNLSSALRVAVLQHFRAICQSKRSPEQS